MRPCCSDWLSATFAIFLCSPVIAEAVEKWKMEREARLARGEEEEEENIYAVHEEEVGDGSGDVTFPLSSVLPSWTWCYPGKDLSAAVLPLSPLHSSVRISSRGVLLAQGQGVVLAGR